MTDTLYAALLELLEALNKIDYSHHRGGYTLRFQRSFIAGRFFSN